MERKKIKRNNVLNNVFRLNKMVSMTTFCIVYVIALISSNCFAESGEKIYKDLCASCHSLSDKALMGPGFAGLKDRRSEEWIIKWVHNSQELIESGDKDAVEVFEQFNKVPMPPFAQLSEDEIKDFISYVTNNQEVSTNTDNVSNAEAVSQNNEATSSNSIFIFGASALILFIFVWLFRYKRKMNNLIKEMGYHSEPHSIPNYSLIFLAYFVLAMLIIYFLVQGLNSKTGMLGILMFVVLPYLSFGIFLIGSIYRYKKRGFQVSSLSSQFLEGKKLYWGSLPFHWGILILFFGHLIAFLFPRAVIAWNGEPVRLLILEISSFAFGLSAFLGLILLIKRRLGSQKLLVVANKMDMLVYTVLFTQIISGLGVAFFVRWGSSWFSSVLTPYLRSIFSFNPDINAVVEMPWLIQVHIISAFLIIGIIPFTRFVHFLVAPIDYIWRKYQIVVWNWNPKIIRVSRKYNFGKKPRNH